MARVEPLLEPREGRSFCQGALGAALALPMIGRGDEAVDLARAGRVAHARLGYQLALFEPAALT